MERWLSGSRVLAALPEDLVLFWSLWHRRIHTHTSHHPYTQNEVKQNKIHYRKCLDRGWEVAQLI